MNNPRNQFRQLLKNEPFIVSPGVYDGYSIRLVEAAGFKTACTSGAAVSNALLGIADIGVMGLAENVTHCRHLARSVSIPLTADADTGYGNPVNVYHTVQMFEEAGVAGINLEDQVSPKRCGHMPGKDVVSEAEMVKKIEAACLARRDDDFVIIARTDSLALEGIEGAVKRARAYARAGADMLFPDAVRSEDDIKRLVDAAGIPVSINMGFGIRNRPTTPLIPLPRLKEIGVKRISLPRMLPAAAIHGMRQALQVMQGVVATGVPADRPDLLVGIEDIMELMGYEQMRAMEKRLTTLDA
ncbi:MULTISPECIES: isocitrate lyase/PEP mutase family protein [Achromobacter]|jgi:2-methylisocitrate lyase-like PEP mutase family enzyme|uniref:Isocitrate lyase/PEP mutase family protein n=1 Tax=Achromobacter denitrificans TaxID=32002 RepID=A0A427WVW9_ACHDE|nr:MULTISPECIES: isocitrate lyase/PEP mutase family protein [Achromobacter]ASC65111.1 carboxyvinyl-carboxyphosphonate phosphorylmutase [Achromobacter denitrificans]MPT38964.1 isocitrate lyase/PEP mutase family protein [Achromobacter sp.]OLU09825.1 carboxyvinyl-carboxyphosphonate phosphorylmutase [Achromobacter denitrificans]QCS63467.1 isocitrate lyase/PEP mutase family protein [Achromobacter denitrificans]QKH43772.1 isocitrate lyase/PEP mutase family protein [Achromobacter denitrificans]